METRSYQPGPLVELGQNAHLILSFARRDIRAKYKQTAFGLAWAVIQPLALMVVFTFVFSLFARIPSEGIPYPLFAYSVLIFWMFFASCISQGTVAMTANANLVRKIYFPRETMLFAVMISAFVDLLVAAVILGGMFIYFSFPLHLTALWIVPLLGLQILCMLSIILLTSTFHVYFRDVGHALPLMLQLWMYATPIAYPLSSVPEWLRPYYLLNPMAFIVDAYRGALFRAESPSVTYLVLAYLVGFGVLAGAYSVFKRAERNFADVI